jgi:NhaP-type Na+/H+ or K+/H+ antiporter
LIEVKLSEQFLIGLGVIILFGMMAQWLAWRLHLPSILLLLILGIVAGPVAGWVNTETLFGNLLFPFVSIAVGIILFEGGLSLQFREFRNVGKIIRNLISIGALVTWIIATAAAYYLLDFEFKLALLFGAILIVTGPTVILPMLRQIRPKGSLFSIAKWEGIMIDPVGAIIAVLVFEEIVTGGFERFSAVSILGLIKTVIIGIGIGWLGAQLIIFFLKRYWIPDFLHNSAAIMMVITTFILSNLLQHESGLLTVTLMGILLANQKKVPIKHIVEFKENLRVILISTLFIILASRLRIEDLSHLNTNTFVFLGILIFIARPISVFVSTIGLKLNLKEKLFLSWLAPRGIVAAAVSSIFAIELSATGYSDAERLIPLTFIVIIGTVILYGLSAVPLARLLKLSEPNPQGILIVGAHRWARKLAKILKDLGFRTLLIDSNPNNIEAARGGQLEAVLANVLSEDIIDELNLQGIGKLFAVTPNDEVNALASLHFTEIFGRSEVYQLPYKKKELTDDQRVSRHLRGRCLFDPTITYDKLNEIFNSNAKINVMRFNKDEDLNAFDSESILPLVMIDTQNNLIIYTEEQIPKPTVGSQLIYLESK